MLPAGAYKYFVTDLTAPGIKASFSFGEYFIGEGYLTADKYIMNRGSLLPFIFFDFGYFYTDLEIENKSPVQGLILRGGPGILLFLSDRVGLRAEGYYQTYLKDFTDSVDELTGTGFNLGLSVFLR